MGTRYQDEAWDLERRPGLRALTRSLIQPCTWVMNSAGALWAKVVAKSAREWAASSSRIALSAFNITAWTAHTPEVAQAGGAAPNVAHL